MRYAPLAAACAAITFALPAAADASTGTADLAVTRLTVHQYGYRVVITAVAKNLGPDAAEPSLGVLLPPGFTIKHRICKVGSYKEVDETDGSWCEDYGTVPSGGKFVQRTVAVGGPSAGGIIEAKTVALDDSTDPSPVNDTALRNFYF